MAHEKQSYTCKQVIVMRKDLNMRKGKIAAQAAHASMKILLDNAIFSEDGDSLKIDIKMPISTADWFQNNFAKICVTVDSEEELFLVLSNAKELGLLTSLVTDIGNTEFNGVPTNTCIAIGPAIISEIDKITGHLKLY